MVSAMGMGVPATRHALFAEQTGLVANDLPHSSLPTWIGKVNAADSAIWSEQERCWRSRCNALATLGLQQDSLLNTLAALKEQFSPARIGIVIGSSTSSIDQTEEAYRQLTPDGMMPAQFQHRELLNPHGPGLFVAHFTGITGPTLTISTACSSSAKVFATAARWLNCGIVDAVLVGGVDALCLSVLHGFHSLQLISTTPCRPFDAHRDGINIGEAAGFAILAKADVSFPDCGIELSGYGESSDAHHMSHPHPDGLGAKLALDQALQRAQLSYADIDYINLHGTASQANDLIEGTLLARLFANTKMVASSTKGWTGHTLGAAGIVEAIISMEVIRHQFVPACLNLQEQDSRLTLALVTKTSSQPVQHVVSNSFGFGGNNCSLIFSRAEVP
jgi:3-oxoacyl-[acyl-carrier-protein] synthase I